MEIRKERPAIRRSYNQIRERILSTLSDKQLAVQIFYLYRHSFRGLNVEARFAVHEGYTSKEFAREIDKQIKKLNRNSELELKYEEETGKITFRLDGLVEILGIELVRDMVRYKTAVEDAYSRRLETTVNNGGTFYTWEEWCDRNGRSNEVSEEE